MTSLWSLLPPVDIGVACDRVLCSALASSAWSVCVELQGAIGIFTMPSRITISLPTCVYITWTGAYMRHSPTMRGGACFAPQVVCLEGGRWSVRNNWLSFQCPPVSPSLFSTWTRGGTLGIDDACGRVLRSPSGLLGGWEVERQGQLAISTMPSRITISLRTSLCSVPGLVFVCTRYR